MVQLEGLKEARLDVSMCRSDSATMVYMEDIQCIQVFNTCQQGLGVSLGSFGGLGGGGPFARVSYLIYDRRNGTSRLP